MATSGTVAFRPNVEEIITEAFERCNIDPQTQTGDRAVSARRSLNLLFSEWANRGINYWAVEEQTLALVSGTTSYTLPAGTIDIISAVIRDSGAGTNSDQIVNRVSISDYNQLPNKSSQGKPSQYMLDKQVHACRLLLASARLIKLQHGLLGNSTARRCHGVKPRCRHPISLERMHLRWVGKQVINEVRT